jgi:hypothetical protein
MRVPLVNRCDLLVRQTDADNCSDDARAALPPRRSSLCGVARL